VGGMFGRLSFETLAHDSPSRTLGYHLQILSNKVSF